MSKNINTNTAIAQIILSKDHEIRLKKKPKKKSSGAKKKALEDVKEQLRNYDLAINQAKSKNVTLPSELGILPVQIDDVNSVKELQALSIKLQSMTNQINQLIVKGASQQRTIGLFQEQIGGQRQGFLPPLVQPRIIEPQQISPEKPIPIRPVRPELVDPSKKPIDDTNTKFAKERVMANANVNNKNRRLGKETVVETEKYFSGDATVKNKKAPRIATKKPKMKLR